MFDKHYLSHPFEFLCARFQILLPSGFVYKKEVTYPINFQNHLSIIYIWLLSSFNRNVYKIRKSPLVEHRADSICIERGERSANKKCHHNINKYGYSKLNIHSKDKHFNQMTLEIRLNVQQTIRWKIGDSLWTKR